MKSKSKTKHPSCTSKPDDGCHGDDVSSHHPGPSTNSQGVRRSTRKRSAPQAFVTKAKKSSSYWSMKEKEKLLECLEEVNLHQLVSYTSLYRYPCQLLRKRIRTKSMEEVKRFLATLERKGAAVTLAEMKQQPPLESWRQMADKLAMLTNDDACRQLIRVCGVMALESKEERDIKTSSAGTHEEHKEMASARTPTGALAVPSASTTPPTSIPSTSTTAKRVAGVPLAMQTSAASSPAEATVAGPSSCPRPAQVVGAASTARSEETPSASSASNTASTVTSWAGDTDGTTTTAKRTRRARGAEHGSLRLVPDYASIYKYMGGLMQGERKELGPLESLVVLDCLKLVEEHLKARQNLEQGKFVQERFIDILQNLYLTIDCTDADKNGNGDVEEYGLATVQDLIGARIDQSRSSSQEADQSSGGLHVNGQSQDAPPGGAGEARNHSQEMILPMDQSASSSKQVGQSASTSQHSQSDERPSASHCSQQVGGTVNHSEGMPLPRDQSASNCEQAGQSASISMQSVQSNDRLSALSLTPQGKTVDQSKGRPLPGNQSASSSIQTSKSDETQVPSSSVDKSTLQGQSAPKSPPKKLKQKPIRLGSLNPFNIPARLLEIRKDR